MPRVWIDAPTPERRGPGRPRKVGKGRPGVKRGSRPTVWGWRPPWRWLLERRSGGRRWWLGVQVEREAWGRVWRGIGTAELRGLPSVERLCFWDEAQARAWRRVKAPWRWRDEGERERLEREAEELPAVRPRGKARRNAEARERRARAIEAEREALAEALALGRDGREYRAGAEEVEREREALARAVGPARGGGRAMRGTVRER